MSSIFSILHVSRSALEVGQYGVLIANHNIANVNTPGYARQELMLQPLRTRADGFGEVGRGVGIDRIRRVTDEFLQSALQKETSEYNEWLASANILDRVEVLTGIDDESSLAAAITNFFNAFDQLSTNVEDDSVRVVVVNAGVTLAERFNALAEGVDQLAKDIDTEVARQSARVTNLLEGIADLNGQIVSSDTDQATSNDLRVQRDQLLNELSQYVKFTTQEDGFGAADVYIAGRQVVHRDRFVKVDVTSGVSAGGKLETVRVTVDGVYLAADRVGGSLGSLIETRDAELKSAKDGLDLLAGTLIDKVNGLHRSGFSPGGSGVNFFEGNDAGSIDVYQLLRSQPEYVAHSYNNSAGDNGLAKDLAGLREALLPELGDRSVIGYFSNLVGEVGSLSATAKGMVENKALTTNQLLTRLESVAGVSIDEEVANVTRYQTMYQAAARMMNTVNEMLDDLLSLGA